MRPGDMVALRGGGERTEERRLMKECKVIRGGGAASGYHGKQGLDYFAGVSAESAGSGGICMHLLVMPPGAEAKPHYHENH